MKLATTGDIVEVKAFQSLANISGDILNVFHFEVTSSDPGAPINNLREEFLAAFYDDYLGPMIAMQSGHITHTRLEINNLMAYTTEFGVFSPDDPVTGAITGGYMTGPVAWSFQLVRVFRTTRNGSKRVAGVAEALADNNVPTSGAVALATDVADRWRETVAIGVGAEFMSLRPVIIRKPLLVTTPPTIVNPVSSVIFRGLGTQNSRKQLL